MTISIDTLKKDLQRLRTGGVPANKIYGVIHAFGEAGFKEAKDVVESYLKSDDPQLRNISLNVLTLHWKCLEHRVTCENTILHDEDSENRRLAVMGLAALLQGTKNPDALKILLTVFRDEGEKWHVRDAAYSAILYLLGTPAKEQPPATRKLDHSRDVNWDHVNHAMDIVTKNERNQ